MKPLDRVLQRWRAGVAAAWVQDGARLLDVGCADGHLLRRLAPRLARAVGIDPEATPRVEDGVEILAGRFPGEPRLPDASFDCVTLLAVLEHVPDPAALARECHRVLAPGGRVVLTVPHPFVDRILEVGIRLRLLDGMESEQHHGFDPNDTPALFAAAGFRALAERRFQLGLNRLFVFERRA
ncbi:MAG TPA: class I SAM-dependent methyltransferase [Myxococcota bacterium]